MGVVGKHVEGYLIGLHPNTLQVFHSHLETTVGFQDDTLDLAADIKALVLSGVSQVDLGAISYIDLIIPPASAGLQLGGGIGNGVGNIELGSRVDRLVTFHFDSFVLGWSFTLNGCETVIDGFVRFKLTCRDGHVYVLHAGDVIAVGIGGLVHKVSGHIGHDSIFGRGGGGDGIEAVHAGDIAGIKLCIGQGGGAEDKDVVLGRFRSGLGFAGNRGLAFLRQAGGRSAALAG